MPVALPRQASPPLRPLAAFRGSLAQRAYGSLREAILELAVQPGSRLRKGEVCEALGVSRSPVAEAVARLQAERLVDVVPQAGTFVARLSMDEVREGAFLREAIELAAVEAVAGSVTEAGLAELARSLRVQEAMVAAGDEAGFYAADAAMHEALLDLTGHRRAAELARTAWVHVDRARRLVLPQPGRIAESLGEHRAVVAAVVARDGEGARRAMRHHLGQLVRRLEALAAERPELFSD